MKTGAISTGRERRIPDLTWAAGVFVATLIAYGPAWRGGLVWNDTDYVTGATLRSWHGLGRIWFELGATEQYYPVLHSAFWVEHRLWGDWPLGYHLANILGHATSACLLALVLGRLSRGCVAERMPAEASAKEGASIASETAPWLAAFLFALHPICVESVAWISEQKNTLSLVFYLSAALVFLRFEGGRRSRATYALATLLFILALLTKSVTATLPAALFVVLWWRRGHLSCRRDLPPLLPWLALGAASGLFTAWVERTYLGAQGTEFVLTGTQRCLVAGRALWFYLGKLLWPAHLTFIYPRWTVDAAAGWQYLFPLAALGLTWSLWLFRGRSRGPLAAWLLFAGSLFPTLGFFNVYAFIFSYVADHWEYLASLGIIALAAAGWARMGGGVRTAPMVGSGMRQRFGDFPWPRSAAAFGSVAFGIVGLLGILTWKQCGMYRDAETLYRATLGKNPSAWMAQNNLGILLAQSGRLPEGIGRYEEALRLRPNYPEARNNLGNALARSGRLEEAIGQYREALRLNPAYRDAHGNLGDALLRLARRSEAVAEYEEALRIDPDYPQARNNLGSALRELGRFPEAVEQFRRAAQLEPENPEVHNDLGLALAETGQLDEGIAEVKEAVRLKPNYAEAGRNLSVLLDAAARKSGLATQASGGRPAP